jgi:hypothetical protein
LALPPADPTLVKPVVVAPMTLTPMKKQIEQVGNAYEVLKKRYATLEENMKNGASANFDDYVDSEESEEEIRERAPSMDEAEKGRVMRGREIFERDACEAGDLYALLELEHLTWEANDK